MPATILLGVQWGDEGKGKLTDLLAERADLVVRYQGGDNAGHTIVHGEEVYKLHLIPSGILFDHIVPVIGNGAVVNPRVLLSEMDGLVERGVDVSRLRVSNNAHLVMPYHLALDKAAESKLGRNQIGTTCKGIGPTYTDKTSRIGLRTQDLMDPPLFREKLELVLGQKNALLEKVYGLPPCSATEIAEEYLGYAERLRSFVADTSLLVSNSLDEGREVILEGAQGTLLDLDHGTYPFVTSSSPCVGGAIEGAGVSIWDIDGVIGVAKAYTTRVGSGPFPSEDYAEVGEQMRETGAEFGTTTGRARRCGWFDAVLLKYSVRLNGLSAIALTKLDVLSSFKSVKICTAYEVDGERYTDFPDHQSIFHKARPVYEEMEGWEGDISGVRVYGDLPAAAQRYVERLEELAGVPASLISVGASREQTILREPVKGKKP